MPATTRDLRAAAGVEHRQWCVLLGADDVRRPRSIQPSEIDTLWRGSIPFLWLGIAAGTPLGTRPQQNKYALRPSRCSSTAQRKRFPQVLGFNVRTRVRRHEE